MYADGKEIPCQLIKEECTFHLDWRKRIVFCAPLKPLSVTRFCIQTEKTPVKEKTPKPCELNAYIANTPLLAPVTLEMADDSADPWVMSAEELGGLGKNGKPFAAASAEEAARFCGFSGEISPVHFVEEGEVCTAAESVYRMDNTFAAVEYKTYTSKPYVDLKVTVEYGEKNKLVRLKVPAPSSFVIGDGPYVVERKSASGEEISFQKWLGVRCDDGEVFAVLNNCLYGGSYRDGCLCFTLLRGAGYCMHPIEDRSLYPTDRYLPRIESGRYVYNFRIMTGSLSAVATEAELFNASPYALNVFPVRADANVQVKTPRIYTSKPVINSVCRYKDTQCEMRFFNPTDKADEFDLHVCDVSARITMRPYEIVTAAYDGNDIRVRHDKILS